MMSLSADLSGWFKTFVEVLVIAAEIVFDKTVLDWDVTRKQGRDGGKRKEIG